MEISSIKKHTIADIIEILGETHQSDGLHIHFFKNTFTELPISYPFRSDNYAILLVLSGSFKIQLNLISQTITRNEIIVLTPQTVIHPLEISDDLEIIALNFSMEFALKNAFNRIEFDSFDFFAAKNIPKISLLEDESNTFIILSKLLQEKNTSISEVDYFKDEIISHSFSLLMYHYASIFKRNYPELIVEMSRQEELTLRFLKTLDAHYKTERSVRFYADDLFVTSGHLSKVLKEVSGKTASELIDDAVIMEARLLLANPSLTIAQIANELQFSDQSFFGKYFKKCVGVSPSSYRNKIA